MIQSAKEFAYDIWDFNSDSGEWPEYRDKIGALIRSRDREIIEACKVAMLGRWRECFANRNMAECTFVSALDSVLREIS
jgi:hypothetical protein